MQKVEIAIKSSYSLQEILHYVGKPLHPVREVPHHAGEAPMGSALCGRGSISRERFFILQEALHHAGRISAPCGRGSAPCVRLSIMLRCWGIFGIRLKMSPLLLYLIFSGVTQPRLPFMKVKSSLFSHKLQGLVINAEALPQKVLSHNNAFWDC